MTKLRVSRKASQISILVDHSREGRFVFAFCPLCDHAEEAAAPDNDHATAAASSIAIIRRHLRHKHRVTTAEMETPFSLQPQVATAESG